MAKDKPFDDSECPNCGARLALVGRVHNCRPLNKTIIAKSRQQGMTARLEDLKLPKGVTLGPANTPPMAAEANDKLAQAAAADLDKLVLHTITGIDMGKLGSEGTVTCLMHPDGRVETVEPRDLRKIAASQAKPTKKPKSAKSAESRASGKPADALNAPPVKDRTPPKRDRAKYMRDYRAAKRAAKTEAKGAQQ